MKLGSLGYWFGLNKAVICRIVTLGRHDTHIFLYNRNGILVDYLGYTPNTSLITAFKWKWEFQSERSRDVEFPWASRDCQKLQDSSQSIALTCDSDRAFSVLRRLVLAVFTCFPQSSTQGPLWLVPPFPVEKTDIGDKAIGHVNDMQIQQCR